MHRERSGHVGDHHGQGAPLRRRELVGQCPQEPRHQRPVDASGDLPRRHVVAQRPRVHLDGAAAQDQGQLQPEELVEDQAPAGRRDDGRRLGQVDGPEGLGPAPQIERRPPLLRQGVRQLAGAVERLLDVGADLPARQTRLGRSGVDRQNAQRAPAGADRGRDDVDDRVHHLAAAPVLPDLPPEDGLGARARAVWPARAG